MELDNNLKLLKNKATKTSELEEHSFIASCLQNGFTIKDLFEMEYVDIAKIMICMITEDKKYRQATAEDWDNLM